VLTDLDSEDWMRRGVADILAHPTPRGTRGGIIMFHDGGGNRSQTLAAVAQLIPRLRARGFRFVTVSAIALLITVTGTASGLSFLARLRADRLWFATRRLSSA
jgi:peptidoglycan/xylan/chitin deacetylase (PgdA/CDA1 family)